MFGPMRLEDLGLIGNCQFSALVHRTGNIVWCCLPRFDSEPVFASLLDEAAGGSFVVGAADGRPGTQRYLPNTNVLETRLYPIQSAHSWSCSVKWACVSHSMT